MVHVKSAEKSNSPNSLPPIRVDTAQRERDIAESKVEQLGARKPLCALPGAEPAQAKQTLSA
jgi:hypothetical protein